jgi:hypothetical protein
MTLKEVAAISGKPGLYKILKPTRNGVIVEGISQEKKKLAVNSTQKVSVLEEISIYVKGMEEESIPLTDVFLKIKDADLDLESVNLSDKDAAFEMMEQVLPEFDEDRVYHSDIKKLFTWYLLLEKHLPEVFEEAQEDEKEIEKEAKA